MKKILCIMLSCSFILSCDKDTISEKQAEDFIKFYTTFPEFTGADVAVTEDGYAVLGTAKTLEGGTWICMLRTDKFGNSVDSARIYGISRGSGPSNIAYCIKALEDGGFGILGSILNPASGQRSAYFVRTNHVGDTLWTRTISSNGSLEARYFEVSDDESFYMTGYFDSPDKNRQIWWFGIDNLGNDIRNQRTQGFEGDDEGTHLVILPDGGLLIAGFIATPSGTKSYIIITDETTVAQKPMEIPSSASEKGECILPLGDNFALLLATTGNASGSQIALKKIDLSAIYQENYIVWEKSYSSPSPEVGKSLMMDGQFNYILGTTNVNSSNTLISLLKTDLSGNETDRMQFGNGSKLSASAFKRSEDGGIIIAGTNVHLEVNNTSAALIKIH